MGISDDYTGIEILASELLVIMEIMTKDCWGSNFSGPLNKTLAILFVNNAHTKK